jgi:hypothetical protein
VQEYTQEFRKRALVLGIPLYTQETLLKYIGGLHTYLRHIILMFNPTNLDEVCVQETHIESKGKNVHDVSSAESVQEKEGKEKWKVKHAATMKKGDERPTCSHYQKQGHEEAKCWKLHPEMKPKWFKYWKGKQTSTVIVEDLGSDSEDETKITIIGVKGKSIVDNDSNIGSSCASTSKDDDNSKDRKRNALFHIRVITKQTKVDTLIDSGSQVNLISEEVVKQLGLTTKPHKKPYPLGWVCKDKRLQVTQQCDLKFAITSKFVDEVEFDVVPLDIYGIVLGSPYLYDRKVIFYREHNQYHLVKEGIEYIVHSHSLKNDKSLGTTQQLKRVVNASQNLALMSIQCKEEKNLKHEEEVEFHYNAPILVDSISTVKSQHSSSTISFTCSMFIFSLLLISGMRLGPTMLNEDVIKNVVNVLNNVSAVLIVVLLRQMYRFQEEWIGDTGQVRQTCPHLFSEWFHTFVDKKVFSGKV